jgi:hypothetical protein
VPTLPLAHVAWYTNAPRRPYTLELILDPVTLLMLAAVIAVAVVWRFAARRLPVPALRPLEPLGRLAPWVPRILAVHLGVSLLALAVSGAYLAPHLSLRTVPGGSAIALAEGLIGVWLVSGVLLRPAALAVVLLGPLGLVLAGPLPVLERVDLLGIALFLALVAPGPDSWGARQLSPRELRVPLLALRAAVGLALVVLAFSEKLLAPAQARALLAEHPTLNVLSALGIEVTADAFIRVAAVGEFLLGLLILSGAGPQLIVLAAGIPFNATLLVFDRFELIGHLPVYGMLLALLVYGSSRHLAAATWWLGGHSHARAVGTSPE